MTATRTQATAAELAAAAAAVDRAHSAWLAANENREEAARDERIARDALEKAQKEFDALTRAYRGERATDTDSTWRHGKAHD